MRSGESVTHGGRTVPTRGLGKGQGPFLGASHAHRVSWLELSGKNPPGQGIDQMVLDGSLERTCSELGIIPFSSQDGLGRIVNHQSQLLLPEPLRDA